MRAVVQRVKNAGVTIEGDRICSIEKGLMVLLSVEDSDTEQDVSYMVEKLLNLRIFEDVEGKMNRSVSDIDGEILLVSQFTLHGDARKGRRPSFIKAARPETAIPLYEEIIKRLGMAITVKTGVFGADMQVDLTNDGPVTILLDSKRLF
ncbi:MAG: D-tyrosyl-tRNA(Tyr) deacylase [Clostridia bacterium]|nr:D-tyrosyl-tRNA(Tyr) deacylase [Clostridia bacterium]